MKIIGIDPGYATIGYGVLDYRIIRFQNGCSRFTKKPLR